MEKCARFVKEYFEQQEERFAEIEKVAGKEIADGLRAFLEADDLDGGNRSQQALWWMDEQVAQNLRQDIAPVK
jgi:hypothetical protein